MASRCRGPTVIEIEPGEEPADEAEASDDRRGGGVTVHTLFAQDFVAPPVEWWHISPLHRARVGRPAPARGRRAHADVAAWRSTPAFTVLTTLVAGVFAAVPVGRRSPTTGRARLLSRALAFDTLTQFLTITICAATLLVALVTADELHRSGTDGPEIYALMLVAATGGVVMAAANDLIVLFLGLETLSLALYVLAASDRDRRASQESGIKYFVLGGFASAFFLYGIALVYGGTQTDEHRRDRRRRSRARCCLDGDDPMVLAGMALLIVGLGFKVAAVPFHVWTPDVYQGSPTAVTAFMASVGKAAAFAAMLRVLVVALPFHRDDWRPAIWVLAVVTLVIGSVLAVVQTDVKRMLAYSSISHAGFILVGVEAAGHGGASRRQRRHAERRHLPAAVLRAHGRIVRRGHARRPEQRRRHVARRVRRAGQAPPGAGARR